MTANDAATPQPDHDPGLTSDLRDLRNTPLARVAEAVKAGDAPLEQSLQRIAPYDGSRVLLAAASFNSAI